MENKDFKFYMKMCVAATLLVNGLLTLTLNVHPFYIFIFTAVLIVQSVLVRVKED